jgi:hypothetical protein
LHTQRNHQQRSESGSYSAFAAGDNPLELTDELDILEFCYQMTAPHMNDETRKKAFTLVIAIADKMGTDREYCKSALIVLIKLCKGIVNGHE